MSEDYNKFDEIRPFTVKTDPSLVLNEEVSPWLRPNQKKVTPKKYKKIVHGRQDKDVGTNV